MDFKAVYDAVNAQNDVVQELSAQIEEHFANGETDQALALEPKLDEALAKADQLTGLYNKLVAKGSENVAANFVLAAEADDDADQLMTRVEFDALSQSERSAFALKGGVVVDEEGDK